MRKFTIFLILIFILGLVPVNFSKAENLGNKLKGRILLQVESKGEAWYVYPDNSKIYYLGRPADAFKIMRELGLGITNKDFNSWNGNAPSRLSGKILLKVEDNGKAYYVNPVDLKMHFLGKPADAFKVMGEMGMGISNKDLEKIIDVKFKQESKPLNDSDNDGLSDVDEIKYGTDPKNPDSDNDGYLDGDEIKNGYNPIGEGKINKSTPDGKACPEIISTATINDLADAIILVIDNNCQTLAGKFGAQSVFEMDTDGRDAIKLSMKKYGILVDERFDEKKDVETSGRICLDFEGELICSPISLYKDTNGNWIILQM